MKYHHAMPAAWTEHAFDALSEHGHRAGGARAAVIEALGRHGGCVDADELVGKLRRDGKRVGVASVYRALGLLSTLGVLQRVPVAGGSARYELVGPGGDHHHHLVCDDCGKVEPFEDPTLESAIERVADGRGYAVAAHDVVLRGACEECRHHGAAQP